MIFLPVISVFMYLGFDRVGTAETLLLAVGFIAAVLARSRIGLVVVALFLLFLLLYFGPATLGQLADVLPLHDGLLFHRFVGGVEIQMRLSGSATVADGPYSFSSRFALVSTFSPGAIACAAPLMVHTSLKNSGGDCAKTSEVSDKTTTAARMRLLMKPIIQPPQI